MCKYLPEKKMPGGKGFFNLVEENIMTVRKYKLKAEKKKKNQINLDIKQKFEQ